MHRDAVTLEDADSVRESKVSRLYLDWIKSEMPSGSLL